MSAQWKYQIRIYLGGDRPKLRDRPGSQKLKWLLACCQTPRKVEYAEFDYFLSISRGGEGGN